MRFLIVIVLSFISSFGLAQSKSNVDTTIVRDVDVVPQFRGGQAAWQSFLQKTIDIRNAIEDMDSTQYVDFGLRQTAILEFTVCEDGEVCEIDILNESKISPAFAEEAIRVMKRSPKWKPAMKNNKAVRTRFRQPITAILDQF
ncbi:energy transducer TonB [Sphingobacterium sp. 1.A.5]|uniref:energy transducer TonB n=1 Tax=Sphingobacterium sp. 1.A.5 TaxID=2044604 RepID=UPI000C0BBB3F|nr:energy transducer TonB [Sphingobacterium sp. 1.A.5]